MTSKAKKLSGFPNEIPYDNTVSGLTATDVQAAIDEVTGDQNPGGNAPTSDTEGNGGDGKDASAIFGTGVGDDGFFGGGGAGNNGGGSGPLPYP